MLPLALMMKARGATVVGSDRSHDQGRTPERFAFIERQGIVLFPQDGSGVDERVTQLVVSTAVEKTVPDYAAALKKGIPIVHRAALLADLSNQAKLSLGVAGTSGKSTTTGMLGWILHEAQRNPSIMNGAVMKNFVAPDLPFASAVVGDPDLVVTEVDESDGSIAHFAPTVAIINNIALDHKSLEELRTLFFDFARKARQVVLNLDNEETARLAKDMPAITYSLHDASATLTASHMAFTQSGVTFDVTHRPTGQKATVTLQIPGHHNIANALAALGGALAVGVAFEDATRALSHFTGMVRRLDVVGNARGITVIDDFAHNPDKIAATLRALHLFEGRLLILFQPHGYGPLKMMRQELGACFAEGLAAEDCLYLCDPLYLGGTVSREVTSAMLIDDVAATGRHAFYRPERTACVEEILKQVQSGDRVLIMGARDDTLPELARGLLGRLQAP